MENCSTLATVSLHSIDASRHFTAAQVFAIYGTAASIAAELWRPRSVLPPLGRAFFTLLQGAWLVQIARIMWGGEQPRSTAAPFASVDTIVNIDWIGRVVSVGRHVSSYPTYRCQPW